MKADGCLDIDAMDTALRSALSGPVSVLNRMRLACTPLSADGDILPCAKSGMSSRVFSWIASFRIIHACFIHVQELIGILGIGDSGRCRMAGDE